MTLNTQIQTNTSDPVHHATPESQLYPPSFLDRFMNAVEQLPIPYWLTYSVFFVLQSVLFHALALYSIRPRWLSTGAGFVFIHPPIGMLHVNRDVGQRVPDVPANHKLGLNQFRSMDLE